LIRPTRLSPACSFPFLFSIPRDHIFFFTVLPCSCCTPQPSRPHNYPPVCPTTTCFLGPLSFWRAFPNKLYSLFASSPPPFFPIFPLSFLVPDPQLLKKGPPFPVCQRFCSFLCFSPPPCHVPYPDVRPPRLPVGNRPRGECTPLSFTYDCPLITFYYSGPLSLLPRSLP